jgi:3-oxo-5-alpha-steroid 4-dehydrogenase 1
MISGKIAWFTQEVWSFLIPAAWLIFYATPKQLHRVFSIPANAILMSTFLLHYFNRDLIFPFRIRAGKPTPFIVWLLAAVFCVYNGYMQARYLLDEAPLDATAHLDPVFIFGMILWLAGWVINIRSDNTLISLRKPTEKKGGYKIPRGGMFEYVSAANYFGEILEWTGWAIASRSLPAVAFAIFTFANLAPRGWKHHLWYKRQFKSYPKTRRAVIPFVW